MSSLDLHSLKVDSGEDFLDAADTQPFHDVSEFELYSLPNSGLTVHHQNPVCPVPFHAHTPYTQIGNGAVGIGSADLHAGRTFSNEGSENFGNMPHPCHGKQHSIAGTFLKHSEDTSSSSTTGSGRDYHRKNRALFNGRRSTGERRDRINERERDRMHMLCDAFEQLREILPLRRPKRGPHRQKLSKISTLVFAQNYIQTLEDILRNPTEYADCQLSPSHDAGGDGCVNLSVPPPSVANNHWSTESDYSAMFNQSELYHQPYTNDAFVDPPYATF